MTTCAYCGKNKKATREHVTPDFIYKLLKQQDGEHLSWNSHFDTYKRNVESVIKDVCVTCNTDYLAKLDSYGQEFVETNNIHQATYLTNLILNYNYSLLSRWLLKIAYNSTRMTKGDNSTFIPYINYLLYGNEDEAPNNKYFFIIIELLKPQLEKEEKVYPIHYFNTGGRLYSNPMYFGVTDYHPRSNNRYQVSCIQIGSLRLHLLFTNKKLSVGHSAIVKRKYMDLILNSYSLNPTRNSCNVKVTDKTWLEHATTPDTTARIDRWVSGYNK